MSKTVAALDSEHSPIGHLPSTLSDFQFEHLDIVQYSFEKYRMHYLEAFSSRALHPSSSAPDDDVQLR